MRRFLEVALVVCLSVTYALSQSGDSHPGSPAQSGSSQTSDSAPTQAAPAQPQTSPTPAPTELAQPAASNPTSQANPAEQPASTPAPTPAATATPAATPAPTPSQEGVRADKRQPKRILGIMPNYRAVSAGEIPPPPTPKQAFKIATQNSFDYSAFIFVGITSTLAEGTNAHPQLGKGVAGFGRYYWRGYLDKTDGNYLVVFVMPTIFHQDERYYAMGEGNFFKRATYSASRILITPDYHGHKSFNFSEVLGRAMAQGVSLSYYPSKDRTLGALAVKYGYAMGRDALTNVFREFWPDIATHVLHRHP